MIKQKWNQHFALVALALVACGGGSTVNDGTSSADASLSSSGLSSGAVPASSGAVLSSGAVASSGTATSSTIGASSVTASSSTTQASSGAVSSNTATSSTTNSSTTVSSSVQASSSSAVVSSSSEVIINGVTTFTDARDGKTYRITKIGNQVWMAQNLNFGTRVDAVVPQRDDTKYEKFCYNDLESNCDTYGGLYQWNEAMDIAGGCLATYTPPENLTDAQCLAQIKYPIHQGLCPANWHMPDTSEYNTLFATIAADGHAANNGQVLRATTFAGGLDLYKFTALGGGEIAGNETVGGGAVQHLSLNSLTEMWTKIPDQSLRPYDLYLSGSQPDVILPLSWQTANMGESVRCIRD